MDEHPRQIDVPHLVTDVPGTHLRLWATYYPRGSDVRRQADHTTDAPPKAQPLMRFHSQPSRTSIGHVLGRRCCTSSIIGLWPARGITCKARPSAVFVGGGQLKENPTDVQRKTTEGIIRLHLGLTHSYARLEKLTSSNIGHLIEKGSDSTAPSLPECMKGWLGEPSLFEGKSSLPGRQLAQCMQSVAP